MHNYKKVIVLWKLKHWQNEKAGKNFIVMKIIIDWFFKRLE